MALSTVTPNVGFGLSPARARAERSIIESGAANRAWMRNRPAANYRRPEPLQRELIEIAS
jgi:hypothetical protein